MFSPYCDGIDRRAFFRVGSLAGLSLAQLLRMQSAMGAEAAKRDVNCIFIFCIGGMSHIDMFDMKPDAPAELRGEFTPIDSVVPGIQLANSLPNLAKQADKYAIVRSCTHNDPDHVAGYHVMMTGVHPGTGPSFNRNIHDNNVHPSFGSMIAHLGANNSSLPSYISVPNFLNSGGPAFLGASCAPFVIEADPAAPDFSVRDIVLPETVGLDRSIRRQTALRQINRFERDVDQVSRRVRSLDVFQQKAYSLMTSQQAKEAFDISRETQKLRDEYGMTSLGQCCLLARRLVEAGCRFISIENGHWDTHRKNTMSLRDLLVPSLDQGVAALFADLAQRGLLESTMVIVATEFGRSPRINEMAGRDHWPGAFSIVMGGGGLKGAQVVGATDKVAGAVTDRPVTPGDFAATLLHVMGINPETILYTPAGRPMKLADGNVIHELV